MSRSQAAFSVVVLISVLLLLWIAMPTVQDAVPVWIIIDALVAQIVIVGALSRLTA